MSEYAVPPTEVELDFADGTYTFALKLPQLAELQSKRECGIFALYGRVMKGRFTVEDQPIGIPTHGEAHAEDLYETIRLALIGGGKGTVDGQPVKVGANEARRLVETYCHPAPLKEVWSTAAAILFAKVEGYAPPKAEPAGEPVPEANQETGSTSQE